MLKLLPSRLWELYRRELCIRKPDQEALKNTKKCPFVRKGEYAKLIMRLREAGIVDLVHEKSTEISGLFGVAKDGG